MADNYSKDDVLKAWSENAGRKDRYDLREVENVDGDKQTQLVDKGTGSVSVAVDGTGEKALRRLGENVGVDSLDPAITPKESEGPESKKQYTSSGNLASPTQPEALGAAGGLGETTAKEQGIAEPAVNQRAVVTPDQRSTPEVRSNKK